jgi:hypothetical protein
MDDRRLAVNQNSQGTAIVKDQKQQWRVWTFKTTMRFSCLADLDTERSRPNRSTCHSSEISQSDDKFMNERGRVKEILKVQHEHIKNTFRSNRLRLGWTHRFDAQGRPTMNDTWAKSQLGSTVDASWFDMFC